MVETIKTIQKRLEKGVYRNEDHVRWCLVTMILEKLGWDVWNPEEFYTELRVEKLASTLDGKTFQGRVDIALRKKVSKDYKPHIFIETKSVDALKSNIQIHRSQLEVYSLKYNVPLSVLTDGRYWEFYLNSLSSNKGKYSGRMICSLNLSEDRVERIVQVLTYLLSPQNTEAALKKVGKNMHREFVVFQYIKEMKPQALENIVDEKLLAHEVLLLIHNKYGKIAIRNKEFSEYWIRYIENEPKLTSEKHSVKKKEIEKKTSEDKSLFELHLIYKGHYGSCVYDPLKRVFTLKKGSEVSLSYRDSFSGGILKRREDLIISKELVLNESKTKYILMKDLDFKSASAASSFIIGASSDGFNFWLDKDGNPLDSHRDELGLKKHKRKSKA